MRKDWISKEHIRSSSVICMVAGFLDPMVTVEGVTPGIVTNRATNRSTDSGTLSLIMGIVKFCSLLLAGIVTLWLAGTAV